MFKVGDRVKDLWLADYYGTVIKIIEGVSKPVLVRFSDGFTQEYTIDGRMNSNNHYISIGHVDKDDQKPSQNTSTLELSFPNLYKEALKNEVESIGGVQATNLWKRYMDEELTLKELGENLLKLSELESKIREELEKMER